MGRTPVTISSESCAVLRELRSEGGQGGEGGEGGSG